MSACARPLGSGIDLIQSDRSFGNLSDLPDETDIRITKLSVNRHQGILPKCRKQQFRQIDQRNLRQRNRDVPAQLENTLGNAIILYQQTTTANIRNSNGKMSVKTESAIKVMQQNKLFADPDNAALQLLFHKRTPQRDELLLGQEF